jgi:hypothetical protein
MNWARSLADADDNDTSTKLPLFDEARDAGPWKGPSMKVWLRRFVVPGSTLEFNLNEDDRVEALINERFPGLVKGATDVRSEYPPEPGPG